MGNSEAAIDTRRIHRVFYLSQNTAGYRSFGRLVRAVHFPADIVREPGSSMSVTNTD